MQQNHSFYNHILSCIFVISAFAACTTSSELSSSGTEVDSSAEIRSTATGDASALQTKAGPEQIPLASLEHFQTPADGWKVYGKVYTTYPGEPLDREEGSGVLMYDGPQEEGIPLLTRAEYGSGIIELEYMLEGEACFSLMLHNRYEIRLCGSSERMLSEKSAAGTIFYGENTVIPPLVDASRTSGVWQRLSVDFHAPQFDESGGKTEHARINRVKLNEETIHRSIELPAVSPGAVSQAEVKEAPLALRVDSGTAAFRNIGFYHDQKIKIGNLHYAYYEEIPDNDQQLAEATPVREGPTNRITSAYAERGNNFALHYNGTIEIPKSGSYKFESIARGEVKLDIGDHTVLQPTPQPDNPLNINLTDRVEETLELKAGEYPFTLQYKKRQSGVLALSVFITGPGIKRQAITSSEGAWRPAVQAPPMPISPNKHAVVIRSHLQHKEKMILNGVSVGDPEDLHYSLDVGNAALLQIWHDAFLDAGPIWTGRGMNPDTRMVAAVGIPESKISFSGRPVVAFLQDENEAWPDSVDSSYRFLGYSNDEFGRPTFRHRVGGLEIQEEFRPGRSDTGNNLIREITLESTGREEVDTWILLADGDVIERRTEDVFSIDDTYFLKITPGLEIHQRRSEGRDELLLHVPASSQPSSFTSTFIW